MISRCLRKEAAAFWYMWRCIEVQGWKYKVKKLGGRSVLGYACAETGNRGT